MTDTDTGTGTGTGTVDWGAVAAASGETAVAGPAPRAIGSQLPPFPEGSAYLVGRLPIECDTKWAVVELPEAIDGLACAATLANVTVLKDCDNPSPRVCKPYVLASEPLNNRQILVELSGTGDKKTIGAGWETGDYPGAAPTTRAVTTGVPVVEVVIIVGPDCGPCQDSNWQTGSDWGQGS